MGPLQKAFLDVAKSLPRTFLSQMVGDKFREAGHTADKKLLDAFVDHLLSGIDKPFKWDEQLPDVVIHFNDKDAEKLNAQIKKFDENMPGLIDHVSRGMTRKMLADYKKKWEAYQEYEQGIMEVFRYNLEDRWGKALNGLRILSDFSREVGERYHRRLIRSKSERNRSLRVVLSGLHLRACQVTGEIIVLLENGFADGAMARWRTLHEIVIVANVIHDGGDAVARRYQDHESVEAKKALDEYIRNHQALGYEPMAQRDIDAITKNYDAVLLKHGKDFKNEYGWASELLGKASPRFADLEAKANLSAMRSYYKMASYNVHAGVRGLTQRIGTVDNPTLLIAGASNAGLEEPGVRTAMSLAALTILLMGKIGTMDRIVEMHALADLRDQTCAAFVAAMRRLRRDERAAQKERATGRRSTS